MAASRSSLRGLLRAKWAILKAAEESCLERLAACRILSTSTVTGVAAIGIARVLPSGRVTANPREYAREASSGPKRFA